MKINDNFDERQKWERGTIFRNGFFAAVIILFIDMAVKDLYGNWAPGRYESQLILMFLITFMSVQLIWKDVYSNNPLQQKALILTLGSISLLLIILGAVHLSKPDSSFFMNGMLSPDGANFLVGILILPISIAYFLKNRIDRVQFTEE